MYMYIRVCSIQIYVHKTSNVHIYMEDDNKIVSIDKQAMVFMTYLVSTRSVVT